MKSLFDERVNREILRRLGNVTPTSRRRFGTMTPSQMINHLNVSFEAYMGKLGMHFWADNLPMPVRLIARLWAVISKWITFTPIPLPRGIRIPKAYQSLGEFDIDREKERFAELLIEYRTRSIRGEPWPEHVFIGQLTPEEYAQLAYKHIDHHFRQFGV